MTTTEKDKLVQDCIKYCQRHFREGAWGYTEAEIVQDTIDLLSTTHRLIDLEKIEAMRKTKTPYLQDHGFNAALDAVIALVKGEK